MKITYEDYSVFLREFISEQFKIDKPVPNQMVGQYGWMAKKKEEFKALMLSKGYEIEE